VDAERAEKCTELKKVTSRIYSTVQIILLIFKVLQSLLLLICLTKNNFIVKCKTKVCYLFYFYFIVDFSMDK